MTTEYISKQTGENNKELLAELRQALYFFVDISKGTDEKLLFSNLKTIVNSCNSLGINLDDLEV